MKGSLATDGCCCCCPPLMYVPTILFNGCQGIASGCSTFIPSYNPQDIIKNIKRYRAGEAMVPMFPWYRGFKGDISKTNDQTYTSSGLYEDNGAEGIRITKLPIGTWTDDYKLWLRRLKRKRKCVNVKVIENVLDNTKVDFTVTMSEKNLVWIRAQGIPKILKLISTISTANMYLFDGNGNLKKNESLEEILEEFCNLRKIYYGLSLDKILSDLKSTLGELEDKAMFIRAIHDGDVKWADGVNSVISFLETKAIPMDRIEQFLELLGNVFTPRGLEVTEMEIADMKLQKDNLYSKSEAVMWDEDILYCYLEFQVLAKDMDKLQDLKMMTN